MSSKFQFRVRTPIASRPFYFTLDNAKTGTSKKSKDKPAISWSVIPEREIIEVMDEQDYYAYDFTVPQESNLDSDYSHINTANLKKISTSSVTTSEKAQSGKQILQIQPQISKTFLSLPYLPSEVFFYTNFAKLAEIINESTIKKDKKTKMPDSGITSRDAKITPPVYVTKISSSQAQASNNIFKAIKKFLSSEDIPSVIQIIRILDADHNNLILECAFQLIIFTNSLEPNEMTIRAWKLMMVFIGRYNNKIYDSEKDILKSYFIGIAGDEKNSINKDIKVYAKICLVRLLCTENLQIPANQNVEDITLDEYIPKSMSLTQILGVSLAEIFIKEEYKGVRSEIYHTKNSNNHGSSKLSAVDSKQLLVPIILQKLIFRLIELDTHNQVGAFRLNGDAATVNAGFKRINDGDWEPPDSLLFATFTSMLKSFTRRVQDALIPRSLFLEASDKKYTSDQIIRQLDNLPNATRDTLLFITGFFQQVSANADNNKMTPDNIAISLGPSITRDPDDMSNPIAYKTECDKRNHVIVTMINNWNTSTIYPFSK